MENAVLNSWKEIATYTGRGVRTLQRWEQELGFPVRRPRGKHRSAVIAIRQEIDIWMRTPHGPAVEQNTHPINFKEHKLPELNNADALQLRASTLLSRSEVLAERVTRALARGSEVWMISQTARSERKTRLAEVAEKSHLLRKNVARAKQLSNALQNPPRRAIIE